MYGGGGYVGKSPVMDKFLKTHQDEKKIKTKPKKSKAKTKQNQPK